jgi:hypothetical protein
VFGSGGTPDGALVLLRGRFDRNRIESLATDHGAAREEYGGRTLFVSSVEPPSDAMKAAPDGSDNGATAAPRHQGALAFLEPDLVAVGAEPAVRAAIDTASSRDDVTKNPQMMGFIAGVEGEGNAWIVGQFSALAHTAALPREVRDHVPPVDWLAASALIDRGIRGHVRAETRDEASADQLRAVINGGLAAVRMMGGNDPRLAGVLNSLSAVGTGRNVELSFALPPEIVDLANRGGARPAGPVQTH